MRNVGLRMSPLLGLVPDGSCTGRGVSQNGVVICVRKDNSDAMLSEVHATGEAYAVPCVRVARVRRARQGERGMYWQAAQ